MGKKIRIYIDVNSLEGEDYKFVNIYECSSPEDVGELIDTVGLKAGVDYVESTLANDPFNWFKLSILDSNSAPIFESEVPILAEFAQDKIDYIRREIKDTNVNEPAFSDAEIIDKIRLAALRYNKIRNLSEVPENVWPIISVLVRIDVCYVLAYDYAKYLRLEIPGGAALSKDELYSHYLNVAEKLEVYYNNIMDSLTRKGTQGIEDELDLGEYEINVSKMLYDRT